MLNHTQISKTLSLLPTLHTTTSPLSFVGYKYASWTDRQQFDTTDKYTVIKQSFQNIFYIRTCMTGFQKTRHLCTKVNIKKHIIQLLKMEYLEKS